MTSIAEHDTDNRLRDWESPGRLLRRYLSAGGMQAIGVALCLLAFVVVGYGWWRISKESIVALQMPYLISGGIGGALMLGLGGPLLVAHDLRLDQRRLEVIEASLNELRDAFLAEPATGSSTAPASSNGHATPSAPAVGFVKVAGGRRFHTADCAVAAGKDVSPVERPSETDLEPCRLCLS